jgi:hypothetical protein
MIRLMTFPSCFGCGLLSPDASSVMLLLCLLLLLLLWPAGGWPFPFLRCQEDTTQGQASSGPTNVLRL